MTRHEMIYEMRLNGISERVIDRITQLCDQHGWKPQLIDAELLRHGCETMFTIYEEDLWEEDDYVRFPLRPTDQL